MWTPLLVVLFSTVIFASDVIVHCGDSLSSRPTSASKCINGWRPFNNGCYRLFYTPKPWAHAADFCALQGGHLTSVSDEREDDFIKNLVVSTGQQLSHWIGGFTTVHSADLLWADGTEWKYSSLHETNTTNSPKRCALVNVVLSMSIEWYMDHCDSEWPFICKKMA